MGEKWVQHRKTVYAEIPGNNQYENKEVKHVRYWFTNNSVGVPCSAESWPDRKKQHHDF